MEKKPSRLFLPNKGMPLVNLLFFLTLTSRSPMFIICTYTIWALVLVQLGKRTESRGLRTFYALLGLFAMAVVGIQTFFLLMA